MKRNTVNVREPTFTEDTDAKMTRRMLEESGIDEQAFIVVDSHREAECECIRTTPKGDCGIPPMNCYRLDLNVAPNGRVVVLFPPCKTGYYDLSQVTREECLEILTAKTGCAFIRRDQLRSIFGNGRSSVELIYNNSDNLLTRNPLVEIIEYGQFSAKPAIKTRAGTYDYFTAREACMSLVKATFRVNCHSCRRTLRITQRMFYATKGAINDLYGLWPDGRPGASQCHSDCPVTYWCSKCQSTAISAAMRNCLHSDDIKKEAFGLKQILTLAAVRAAANSIQEHETCS